MKVGIYQTKTGYEIVTSRAELFALQTSAGGYITKACGTITDKWRGSGRLLKNIPPAIKSIFFNLQKAKV